MALECCGNPVDGGETEAEHSGDGSAKHGRPGFVDDGPEKRNAGEQIAGHDAERKIGEPCAGEGEGERHGGAVEGAAEKSRERVLDWSLSRPSHGMTD